MNFTNFEDTYLNVWPVDVKNYTEDPYSFMESKKWKYFMFYHTTLTVSFTLIGVVVNFLTIMSVANFRYMQTRKNAFICSLSVADLSSGLGSIVWFTVAYLYGTTDRWEMSDVAIMVFGTFSNMNVIMIAIDRYILIAQPLRYAVIVTNRTVKLMLTSAWLFPILVTLPLYTISIYTNHSSNGRGLIDLVHNVYYITCFVTVAVSMVIMYGAIWREARANTKRHAAIEGATTPQDGRVENRPSTNYHLVPSSVLASAVILQSPYFVFNVISVAGYNAQPSLSMTVLEYMGQQCSLLNLCLNAFIYAALSINFRRAYKQLMCFRVRGNGVVAMGLDTVSNRLPSRNTHLNCNSHLS